MKSKSLIFFILAIVVISVLAFFNLRIINSPASTGSQIGVNVSNSINLQLYEFAQNSSGYIQFNKSFTYIVMRGNSEFTYDGKPVVIFVGAEWCPYCGSEIWSLIIALDRFGNVSGLKYMESSSTDIYPNVPTFTLENLTYSSNYISVLAYEFQDRNHQPLQSVPQNIYQLWNQLGNQSIPFIDIAGIYYQVGTPLNPGELSQHNWSFVLQSLEGYNDISYQIYSEANLLTAEICLADGGQPAHVCDMKAVVQYENVIRGTGSNFQPQTQYILQGSWLDLSDVTETFSPFSQTQWSYVWSSYTLNTALKSDYRGKNRIHIFP